MNEPQSNVHMNQITQNQSTRSEINVFINAYVRHDISLPPHSPRHSPSEMVDGRIINVVVAKSLYWISEWAIDQHDLSKNAPSNDPYVKWSCVRENTNMIALTLGDTRRRCDEPRSNLQHQPGRVGLVRVAERDHGSCLSCVKWSEARECRISELPFSHNDY